ncbi:MAG: guanylate kinase [Bacteroidales bacterium]|nr:guanylate kinase [Bacteroidales bacterium]
MKKGKLIIISAPSGSGKSTIIGRIINDPDLKLEFSISATTRAPREGEIDGVHYHFITVEQFKEAIKNDALVEYEEVYPGRFYGTLKSEIERIQNNGKNVILDIDVKGGINVKRLYGDNALSVFIQPPSIEALRQRLISRATDPIEAINQRVGKAEYELSFKDQFDTVVVNDNLDKAVEQTRQLLYDFVK